MDFTEHRMPFFAWAGNLCLCKVIGIGWFAKRSAKPFAGKFAGKSVGRFAKRFARQRCRTEFLTQEPLWSGHRA